ncbi:GlsB/YeaQ/YmgE family stress response membrane protein [Caenimonas terrae]|uniref:GlsB/YeaQ/YmgE family stress response membrane protein n=1 Tax=Caenimonas terrae TaxID=696074 RepID=A0ABW0NDN2_9BURK
MIENVLVGMFGAFIGGDFVAAMISAKGVVNDKDFRLSSLGMAIAGAVVMLVLLRIMRRAVGPMRGSKSKAGRRN